MLAAVLALIVVAGAWLALTSDGTRVVIDGWLVGPLAACQDRVVYADNVEFARGRCDELLPAAVQTLDLRDPGHATILSAQLRQRLWPPETAGGLQYVAVFRLADGSRRAIGVGWPGITTEPLALEYGP